MNRRQLLSGVPAAGMAMSATAQPGPDQTPILRLFEKHCSLTSAGKENREFADDPRDQIEEEMMALPSTCAADLAAKMIVAHCYGEFSCLELDCRVWTEARALVGASA